MKMLRSFWYAFSGIKAAFKQRNLRIHLAALALVTVFGFYFGISAAEWCIILLASALVIGLEMINTSIEHLTDLVTKEQHPLAGKVKDIAAGAVLFASLMAFVIGIIIFAGYVRDWH